MSITGQVVNVCLGLSFTVSGAALAIIPRAYLSSTGNDANPCSLQQPCRLLPRAIDLADDGGEVWMLDSANYNVGQVEITKSLTLAAIPGVGGSIVTLPGQAGLNIATGVKVTLRNLILQGRGGFDGIDLSGNAELHVEQCQISQMGVYGIHATSTSSLSVSDSVIRNSGNSGILAEGSTQVSLYHVRLEANQGAGLSASNGPRVAIRESSLAANGNNGVLAFSDNSATPTYVTVEASVLSYHSGNGSAALAGYGAGTGLVHLTTSDNTVSHNYYPFFQSGNGAIYTRGNNTVIDNTMPSFGAITPLPGQ